MSQNSKGVHWPEKVLEAAELQPLIREGIMVLRPLGGNDELDRTNAHLWNNMYHVDHACNVCLLSKYTLFFELACQYIHVKHIYVLSVFEYPLAPSSCFP